MCLLNYARGGGLIRLFGAVDDGVAAGKRILLNRNVGIPFDANVRFACAVRCSGCTGRGRKDLDAVRKGRVLGCIIGIP